MQVAFPASKCRAKQRRIGRACLRFGELRESNVTAMLESCDLCGTEARVSESASTPRVIAFGALVFVISYTGEPPLAGTVPTLPLQVLCPRELGLEFFLS